MAIVVDRNEICALLLHVQCVGRSAWLWSALGSHSLVRSRSARVSASVAAAYARTAE